MELSVILCTRNRAAKLQPCLEAMAAIRSSRRWELVIVDNGSTDNTRTVIEAFLSRLPTPSKYISEGQKGLSKARNAGLKNAEGKILLFTDDDCYVAPDIVDRVLDIYEAPRIGFSGGRIDLYDHQDAPITILTRDGAKTFAGGSYIRTGEIQGANMAFRREALLDIGGFDPLFGSGSYFPAEDIDAVARTCLRGWDGVYDPRVRVQHHHGRKRGDLRGLFRDYDRGRGAYHMKLLVRYGKVGWFLRGLGASLQRLLRHPRGVLQETIGGWEYLWRSMALRAGEGAATTD